MQTTQQHPAPSAPAIVMSSPDPAGPAFRRDVPAGQQREAAGRQAARSQTVRTVRELAIDLGLPLGSYYLLRDGLGASLWLSLAASSIGPAVRSVYGMAVKRELNLLAMLMLFVNLTGIGVSFLTGDPRAMIAKDSIVSSVIGFAMLGSVALRRPIMAPGLRLFLTKGAVHREEAYEWLHARSATFRRLDGLYTVVWGVVLLAECTARLIGAYTLPVTTMVWLGGVLTMGAIGLAIVVGGVAAGPMLHMVEDEVSGRTEA